MNKNEIIQAVSYAGVPEGSSLVEHNVGATGSVFSNILQGKGGVDIVSARLMEQELTADTSKFPDEPSAALLEHIHFCMLGFILIAIEAVLIPELEAQFAEDHKIRVHKLRQISKDLGIPYKEPRDLLMMQ